MKLFSLPLYLLIILNVANVMGFSISEIGKSAIDSAKGVFEKVPDVLPSPDSIFQAGKNLIAGYPIEVAIKAINTFCK